MLGCEVQNPNILAFAGEEVQGSKATVSEWYEYNLGQQIAIR